MKLRRKIVSVFISAIVVLSFAEENISAWGNETSGHASNAPLGAYLNEILPQRLSNKSAMISEEIFLYTGQALPYYLSANELYGNYDFFEPIRIQNWDNDGEVFEKYLIAVAKGRKVLGIIMVTHSENRLISGFRSISATEMSEAFFSDAEVQIGYKNGFLLLFDGESFMVIEGPDSTDIDFLRNMSVDEEWSETVEIAGTVLSTERTNTRVWEVSGMNLVHNDTGVSHELLCWASCIACMGMQNKPDMIYSAKSVYEMCRIFNLLKRFRGEQVCTNTSFLQSEEPHGCVQWERLAFSLVGIPAETDHSLNARQIADLLSRNKPIMIAAHKTRNAKSTGHTVVLYRYEEINDSCGLYTFMDPGMGLSNCEFVTTLIDRSVMENGENFILPSTTGTYISWYQSFYSAN